MAVVFRGVKPTSTGPNDCASSAPVAGAAADVSAPAAGAAGRPRIPRRIRLLAAVLVAASFCQWIAVGAASDPRLVGMGVPAPASWEATKPGGGVGSWGNWRVPAGIPGDGAPPAANELSTQGRPLASALQPGRLALFLLWCRFQLEGG